MSRLIVIGDIHGCFHTLKALFEKLDYDKTSDVLVFVGDYIDRGQNSYEVVEMVRNLQLDAGEENVICLRGNHEQMAIDAVRHHKGKLWLRNGGQATIDSFHDKNMDLLPTIRWFESLPLVYDTPEIIFCHAGLTYPKLSDNSPMDFLWGRDWIYLDSEPREKQVVFGHTRSRDGAAYITNTGDICVDAGCVYGGNLCAMVIQEDGSGRCIYEPKSPKDATNFSDSF